MILYSITNSISETLLSIARKVFQLVLTQPKQRVDPNQSSMKHNKHHAN